MSYIAFRDQNNAIKKSWVVQFQCSVGELIKAINAFVENSGEFRLESFDTLANIYYLRYCKAILIQDIWLVVIAYSECKTNLAIEVINNRRNAAINHSHENRICFIVEEITKELNRLVL